MSIRASLNRIKKDGRLRGQVAAILSFSITAAFLAYNFFVGVVYRLVWNFSVSFYYLLLTVIKAVLLICEKRWRNKKDEKIYHKRLIVYRLENVFLLLIDFILIAPIIIMLMQKRAVTAGQITAIALAAYTTYKIVMACINYSKSKHSDDLMLKGLRIISLKEAIVSVLTLQNTMVTVFGDAGEMLALTAWTSAGMLASMMAISIVSIIQLKKIKRKKTH